ALGDEAERRAAELLAAEGYRVLRRNFRVRGGEIDLVALDGRVLCFVEVRSRSSTKWGTAAETIGLTKRRRIVAAARRYLTDARHGGACRFDVVTFDAGQPHLIKNAFDL